MNESEKKPTTRREFIKTTGRVAAVSALAGVAIPRVHAAVSNTIQVGLVGCGGRGTGAAANALGVENGPISMVAMADVFENKLQNSYRGLKRRFGDRMDVPEHARFNGFDAYKEVMDSLNPGDVVILTTPPAFRWVHFTYAIKKGLNVFMEKPVTVDGPTTRRMIGLADEAKKKNLKVGVGLMVRHCRARRELFDRIQDGQLGDILHLRAYRMHPPVGSCFSRHNTEDISETLYQIKRFHSFLWASGGLFSDFNIHQIDESCWMKNKWPVKAEALGGRHFREDYIDQNFDTYSVEYTFDDGSTFTMNGRTMNRCVDRFASYAHGTKGLGIISKTGHHPGECRIFKGQLMDQGKLAWAYPQPEKNPYDLEWDDLIDAIRNDKPYNEVKRGAEASMVTSMGRMAAHTGQIITWDDIYNGDHEFAPGLDKLTKDSPAPLQKLANGKYPVPTPGYTKKREYRS